MRDLEFDFSVDYSGEIEEVVPYSETSEIDCETFLKRILVGKKLGLGERTEGNCSMVDDVITLDYRVCTQVGEDWDSDVWSDEKVTFPLTEI